MHALRQRIDSSERLALYLERTEWAWVRFERVVRAAIERLRPHVQRATARLWSHARLWSGIEVGMVLLLTISLAGIVSPAFGGKTASERDQQRLAMLKQTQRALEHYHNEHGEYPSTNGEWWGDPENFGCYGYDSEGYIRGLVPRYLPSLPRDPSPQFPTHDAGWLYMSDGVDYKLLAFKTPESYPKSNPYLDAIRPDTAWQVSTPGAVFW